MPNITKLLVANRGEIAIRIMRTCAMMDIETIGIYSNADAQSLHIDYADEAILLEGESLAETYLNIEKIIAIAKANEVDAIHPGYGFLSENAAFAKACETANITFVGPPTTAIQLMGDKVASRNFADKNGIPLLKGITGSHQELLAQKNQLQFPVIIKASAGGGGKGMRIVQQANELEAALEATAREAKSYFGNDEVFIERYIENPRHIEVQILGDQHGNTLHLYERECTIQRRHQKIIEEAPSITLNEEQRTAITQSAVELAKAANYYSAGTVEFIVDEDLNFYFMEMNTRIQVEHPVTENITGIDLVEEQIKIAEGEELEFMQDEITREGHSIECRIYAEDPAHDFRPSPGEITYYHEPEQQFLRIDASLEKAQTVSGDFDPMIAKLITWGETREQAIVTMRNALDDYVITGIPTNINYLKAILADERFQQNEITTNYCKQFTDEILARWEQSKQGFAASTPALAALVYDFLQASEATKTTVWEEIGFYRLNPIIPMEVDGERLEVNIKSLGNTFSGTIDNEPFEITQFQKENEQVQFKLLGNWIEVAVHALSTNLFHVVIDGYEFSVERKDVLDDTKNYQQAAAEQASGDAVSSPIPGTVVKVMASQGDEVQQGDALIIVEAMKMENTLTAPRNGVVKQVNAAEGEKVEAGKKLIELQEE